MENYEVMLAAPVKTIVPVVKIVGNSCNMRCGYCFYHMTDQAVSHVMELRILEKFIKEYLETFRGDVCLNWHGGEPLLAGLDFFEKIVEYESMYRSPSSVIHNTVQTNGVLLNREWAVFFKHHDFGIGVSIDGDKESHDLFRKTANGASTFSATLRGIEILRENGIEPGIIQTITHSSIRHINENFDFFAHKLKCKHWGINFFSDPHGLNTDMSGESFTNEDFVELIGKHLEQWMEEDNPDLSIREIDNFVCGIVGKRTLSCNWNGGCAAFICVDFDGTVYASCDRMSSRPEAIIGNIGEQPLLSVLNGEKRFSYLKRINEIPSDCGSCEWLDACHNGCIADREENLSGKYVFCSGRKTMFKKVKGMFPELKLSTDRKEVMV